MKRITSTHAFCLMLIAVALALNSGGCASIMPGADPVVVQAERAQQASFATIDAFLKAEDANRDFVKSEMPEVHKFAESLRVGGKNDAKVLLKTSRAALSAYKENKTPPNNDTLSGTLETISDLASTARKYFVQLNTAKAAAATRPAT